MSELYELPEGWEWKKLSDCVTNPKKDIVDGPFGSNLKTTEYIDSGVPIIRLQNIQRFEFINKDIKFISREKEEQLKRHTFISGDIVITKLGEPLGKSCVVPKYLEKGVIVADVIRVRVNEDKTNKSYVEYALNSQFSISQFSDNAKGATRQRVKLTMVRALNIPLPPLQEQKRIVVKLDALSEKIDKAIALHQKNMDEAAVFMGSVLNDVFGELEEKYPLQKVSDGLEKILTGTTPPKKEQKYYDNPTINWYSPSDFGKSKILTKSKNMINEISIMDKKAKVYEKNTLLLVAIGATVGKIGVLREQASSNQQITAIKFKNNIEVDFSYYWFYFIKQIIINSASAATLPIINQSGIKNLKFIIPPLNIQQKTVSYLDEISKKIEKIKQVQKEKMQSLVALKASILDKAFRGEL